MKTTKFILSTVLVAGVLAGCSSSWNQDPLAGKDGVMRDALPKPTNPEKPEVTDSDAVLLEQKPEFYHFTEGSSGELSFSARVLLPDYQGRVIIENLADFPGATFDEKTGIFRWTPQQGTVVNGFEEKRPLIVKGVGEKTGDVVVQREEPIGIIIRKKLIAPEIFSVSATSLNIREGESQIINIKVRDKDATSDPSTWPMILPSPLLGHGNLSQFVTVNRSFAVGNNEFAIDLKVDLKDAELTKSKGLFGFVLQAVSRYQQASTKKEVSVNVLTSFSSVQSTWFDTFEVPLGQKSELQFMIFDPKEELRVGDPSFTGGPAAVSILCSPVGDSRQLCKMTFTPDFTTSTGDFVITAKTTLTNKDPSDTYSQDQNIRLKLKVTDAAPSSQKEGR